MRCRVVNFALAWIAVVASLAGNPRADELGTNIELFDQEVRPLIAKRCLGCHGPDQAKADLRIDQLNVDLVRGADGETWHDVLNRINLGEMPPEDAVPLAPQERTILVDWLTQELRRASQLKRGTGGEVVLRRLTRYEYANTMRDLLGVDLDYAKELPPESISSDGFQNNGSALGISPLQLEIYLRTARMALGEAIVTGERPAYFEFEARESLAIQGEKGIPSNRLKPGDRFVVRALEFPRSGEIRVRVRASAAIPVGAPPPRMLISLGIRADVNDPQELLADVDVVAEENHPIELVYRARIEDFPLPDRNPKYPGFQITVYNSVDGVLAVRKGQKPKRPTDERAPQAEILIESVGFEGPTFDAWPPASHRQILFARDSGETEDEYVRAVLQAFLTRAYRRPATDADWEPLLHLYGQLRPQYPSLEETLREVLPMALISPDFLFLAEPSGSEQRQQPLNDYELATRLSYFLWSTMPDQELFDLAAAGKLSQPNVLRSQVERLTNDPRSAEFVGHFSSQWLGLSALDRVAVNPEFYPSFDDSLKSDMRTETQMLFASLFREDLSALNLIDSDFTFLNRPLAEHYGIAGPRGMAFERVSLVPEDHRGGLLTQGSFLLANSNGEDSHPIKRAVWILDRLLNDPPAPPPPDVPALDPDEPNLKGLSLKRQLELHREKEACNECHRRMDPWGIAVEGFDATGRLKSVASNEPQPSKKKSKRKLVVASNEFDTEATLPDGTRVNGIEDLKQYLLEHRSRQFAEALVERLLSYALGRSLEWSDRPTTEELTERFVENDFRLRPLMMAIVASEAFQSK